MNTPGNNLLGSNAVALGNSGLPTIGFGSAGSVLILAGVVLVAILVLFAVNDYSWSESPWLGDRLTAFSHLWDWLPSASSSVGLTEYGALQSVPTAGSVGPGAPPNESTATRGPTTRGPATRGREHWCFVGEDLTGRWCVKVPHHSACTPERLYETRSECELVTASKSPLGIIKDGGADQTLLAALHTK